MPLTLTIEQIIALAPDAAATKAGQGLAVARKWILLGRDDRTVWGECQGSGKEPYRVQIDLSDGDLAYRCSCPSRKLPCKHTLGLLLLLAQEPESTVITAPPNWVTEWLAKRAQTAQKRGAQQEQTKPSVNPAAQAKRAAQREARVHAGMLELEERLLNLVRHGLAQVQHKPHAFWEESAQRMWDAQARDMAFMVRDLAGVSASGPGWQSRLLDRLGRIYLLITGFKQLDLRTDVPRDDIRDLIGWDYSKEIVLNQTGVHDQWHVMGQFYGERTYEALHFLRTWLRGVQTGRDALIFEETHISQPLSRHLSPGATLNAEVVFYPSAYPLRALLKVHHGTATVFETISNATHILDATERYAIALACHPWIEVFPMALRDITICISNNQWLVYDSMQRYIPLNPHFQGGWQLLALSGGNPLDLFGEWDGEFLYPLGAGTETGFVQCGG